MSTLRHLECQVVIQRQSVAAIPLGGVAVARVLDQNLPHQLGTDGQEMRTVLEVSCALLLQAQIRLVHQGGALQRVVAGVRSADNDARPAGVRHKREEPRLARPRRRPRTSSPVTC